MYRTFFFVSLAFGNKETNLNVTVVLLKGTFLLFLECHRYNKFKNLEISVVV